jgi:acyl-CoA dehydrogenase
MLPFFDQDHASLRSRARAWVDAHLRVTGEPQDVDAAARHWVQQLGKEEFLAFAVPAEFGGKRARVQARDLCILREELARGSALADAMFALQALASYPVTLAGSEEQKRRYLPSVASGAAIGAFALTEPEAGSDVASLQTRALKRDDGYSLSGTKCFISNAGIAAYYVVFAATAPEKKNHGISAFVVDAETEGLIVRERTRMMSPHPVGVIAFENCIAGADSLLGREGEGLSIAYDSLDVLRCTVGAAALGLAQRALEEALRYGRERRQFGRPIGEFQGIQFKLADMATQLEAARLLVYRAAWSNDCVTPAARHQSSMAKLYATEAAQHIIDQALQIHGAVGLVGGHIMERLYRDIRALRIYEGTSEIQKLIIARELLKAAGDEQ